MSMEYNTRDISNYRYNTDGQEYYVGGVILNENAQAIRYSINSGFVNTNGQRFYELKDWLGTSRMLIDDAGEISSARDDYPFVKLMPGRVYESENEAKRYQYTGHEFDEDTQYG
jgi:hypothetical protein